MSNEKILNFLVNDILDFAQMKDGKFRKKIDIFNVQESVQEIINIQKYKTEQLGL